MAVPVGHRRLRRYQLFLCIPMYSYGCACGASPPPALPAIPMYSYVFLWLCLWGIAASGVTSYSYVFLCIPMAVPVGHPRLRSYQLFLCIPMYSYGCACGASPPPELPAIPMYSYVFLWLCLWGIPASGVT